MSNSPNGSPLDASNSPRPNPGPNPSPGPNPDHNTRPNPNLVLRIILIAGILFSAIQIVMAVTPDPGHDFTSISGSVAQGDLLYGSAADTLSALAKNTTATRYLSNTGTSNNPAWAQVNLDNGVTGTLPSTNGGEAETVVRITSDVSNATTTMADATGLSFSAAADKDYIIEGWILWDASDSSEGIKLSASGPSGPTAMAGQWVTNAANGTLDGAAFNGNDVTVTTTAAPFTTGNIANMSVILRNGATAGTFTVRFAAETGAKTITIKAGSVLRYRLLN